MAKVQVTKIEGAAELEKVLAQLPRQMGVRALFSALRKAANIIRDEAKSRVPVLTGTLKDNIVTKKLPERRSNSATVIVGSNRKAFHAHLIEFGTVKMTPRPFLRPAFDTKKHEALDKIGLELGKNIEREATKLSGKFSKSGLGVKRGRKR